MKIEFKAGRLLLLSNPWGGKILKVPKKNLDVNPVLLQEDMEKPLNFKSIPYPQTPQSAAKWFKRHGVCKAHWAKYFNLERTTVEHLLRGQLKGNFGKSHEAAVKLGLKEQSDD